MEHNSPVIKYLESIGLSYVWARNNRAYFYPPYASQSPLPCLAVNLSGNYWVDTSDTTLHGDAADLIALTLSTPRELAEDFLLTLKDEDASEYPTRVNDKECTIITRNTELTTPSLIAMLERRKLDVMAARRHCREIAFSNPTKGTTGYGVAFENMSGGYTYITNRGDVRALLHQDVTIIREPEPLRDECLLFVSPFCYLAFLSLYGEPRLTVYLAFSSSNIKKLLPRINGEKKIIFYAPNSPAKDDMLPKLRNAGLLVEDMSGMYQQYKNLFQWYGKQIKNTKSSCYSRGA